MRHVPATDIVAQRDTASPRQMCSLAPLPAEAIARRHSDGQRDNLLHRT